MLLCAHTMPTHWIWFVSQPGPVVEDSLVGHSGDDFFNVHATLMLVLKCGTPTSCIIVNPGCELPGSLTVGAFCLHVLTRTVSLPAHVVSAVCLPLSAHSSCRAYSW